MTLRGRCVLVVLDGVGIGAAPDADEYGDAGSDTLGNVAEAIGGLDLPNLAALGLGCCRPLRGMVCDRPFAAYGVAVPRSKGKDSTTGHWELCGVILETPFPTYPGGFPPSVIDAFASETGRRVRCNVAGSGTVVIEEHGPAQLETGDWIVYTSADSVFQIAAHEDVIPLDELYRACEMARDHILVGAHAVSRVIARPFRGRPGDFQRTADRRDFSLEPTGPTLLDRLADVGIPRVGVGKVDDLFASRNIQSEHTPTNADAYRLIGQALDTLDHGFIFANVIEFDQSWGHRNDVEGFYHGLRELDERLPSLVSKLRDDDLMLITADHGNDPTTPSTDHSREVVPLLAVGPRVPRVALGDRGTFADIGATAAAFFDIGLGAGQPMLELLNG